MEDFRNGEVPILVATNVAARGLDVTHVGAGHQHRAAGIARAAHAPHRPHRPHGPPGPGDHAARPRRHDQVAAAGARLHASHQAHALARRQGAPGQRPRAGNGNGTSHARPRRGCRGGNRAGRHAPARRRRVSARARLAARPAAAAPAPRRTAPAANPLLRREQPLAASGPGARDGAGSGRPRAGASLWPGSPPAGLGRGRARASRRRLLCAATSGASSRPAPASSPPVGLRRLRPDRGDDVPPRSIAAGLLRSCYREVRETRRAAVAAPVS